MKTSIIIWNYNQLAYTQECLASVRRYTCSGEYELIIVDDGSSDGSPEWLLGQPDLTVLCNEQHGGYPKACNRALGVASGDNILFLDNDIGVSPGWLDRLLCCLNSNDGIGAVGPLAGHHAPAVNSGQPDPAAWEERLRLGGCCLLVKRAVVDRIGLLDETFTPGYLADDDYCFRITEAGYKLILCSDVFVQHAGVDHFGCGWLLPSSREAFDAKWGFDLQYSTGIRWDIIGLVDRPQTQAVTVLEVGCACGATLLQIKNRYPQAELFGIELNEQAAAIARRFAEVIATDIETTTLPYPEEFFDFIILADVLEHLKDPWRVVAALKPFLKMGGQVIASIPNVMHFSVLRDLLQGNWTYVAAGILDRTHLRFFTLNEIRKMFAEAGYTINSCQPTLIYETADDQRLLEVLGGLVGDQQLAAQYRAYQYIIRALKPTAAIQPPGRGHALNAQKICFITCVNDTELYQRCLTHIRSLEIPAGYEVELLPIENSHSMAGAYNQALSQSDAKYKVYLHQDVFITNKKFIEDVFHVFRNPEVGIIGVAGSARVPATGIWWESMHNFGKVYDSHSGVMRLVAFQEVTADYQEVQAVDGLIMITQYDLPWRADIFAGWHFYDLSQSMEFSRAGYKVVVPRQHQPWCIHDSGVVQLGGDYEDYRQAFVQEYLKT